MTSHETATHVLPAVIPADQPLTEELLAAVSAIAVRAEDAPADKPHSVVLYITGTRAGQEFSWPGPVDIGVVGKWEAALRRLEQVPAPIIAVVDGNAYGPAAELLLVADYRILRAGSTFEFAATGSSVWPSMALYRLVAQYGAGPARTLAVQGRTLSAAEAHAQGLVDAVIDDDAGTATRTVQAGLRLFESAAGAEIAIRRRLLLDATTMRFEDALGAHLAASDRSLRRLRAAS
ncbi:(3,5-dihydroxycyclohex-3-enyl)acetyl-CoA dehydratase subunit B [Nocardia amikacinitolerans]|uniref:enoyl-CoA-hydratase DpgB n=1 Tax=Nocardia amikacinitolerans TaxID=756689 RepID=UPI000831EB8E|nr:enoyl-CoA-hydratase DpgB [Nocardia amikacinitolerans]MCP2319978.1 (3,5-dihydroxycyclohex-3-enyl)acetyl-CoA dehydratase subunit B [Nocardia amikacinitolerans]